MKGFYLLQSLNRLVDTPRLKFLAVLICRLLGIRHLSLRIDPAISCNLRCLMCPNAKSPDMGKRFTDEEMDSLLEQLLPMALQVVVGCGYEPTMHKGFTDIIKKAKKSGVPYTGVTTNGQLLRREHLESLINSGLDELIVSMHGVHRDTYEKLMPGASHERLHEVLERIDRTKEEKGSSLPNLRINFAVNSRNISEVSDFFNVFGKYNIHTLNFRPMFGSEFKDGLMSDSDISTYRKLVKEFSDTCNDKGIVLVASVSDEKYAETNTAAIIFPEILYNILPTLVWREDFDWRNESYKAFCKRIKYNKYLLKCIFTSTEKLLSDERMKRFRASGRYDVI